MAGREGKGWRELASAALEARDPNQLLEIVQELEKVLKNEEQVRREFREAARANKPSREILRIQSEAVRFQQSAQGGGKANDTDSD